jgi:hypothetical protein
MIGCINTKMKGTWLFEVWIVENSLYLSSDNFLDFIKGLLTGWGPSNLTLIDVRIVNWIWLEVHFCETTCCDNSWLYQETGIVALSFLVLHGLMWRRAFISTLSRIGWIHCLMIQYPRYSTCSAKNLDLEMFTLIPAVENLARTISNLSRCSLKLLFISINKSSRYHFSLNIFHILDKIRHDILKNIKDQAILIHMSKHLYLYFPICHEKTIAHQFWASVSSLMWK